MSLLRASACCKGWAATQECANHAAALPSPATPPFVCTWRPHGKKKNNQVTAGGASGPRIFIFNFALRFLNSARHEVNLATSGLREKQSLLFRLNCPEPPRSSDLNDVSVSHTLWLVLFAPLIFWDRINSTGICTGAACFA